MKNNPPLFLNTIPLNAVADSYFLVFDEDKLLVNKNVSGFRFVRFSDISTALNGVKTGTLHFIGNENGFNYYCFRAQIAFKIETPGFEFCDLRSLINFFDAAEFRLASIASQVLYWDESTKFCGECGAKTKYLETERAKICKKCSRSFYPVVTPAIIVAVMNEGKILLAHNKKFAGGVYSLIAGFVDPGESLEECVRREVMEETGVTVAGVKYLKSQPWPFPSSLMVGFSAQYLGGEIKPDGVEIAHAAWFGREDLPPLPRPGSLSRNIIDVLMSE